MQSQQFEIHILDFGLLCPAVGLGCLDWGFDRLNLKLDRVDLGTLTWSMTWDLIILTLDLPVLNLGLTVLTWVLTWVLPVFRLDLAVVTLNMLKLDLTLLTLEPSVKDLGLDSGLTCLVIGLNCFDLGFDQLKCVDLLLGI